MTTPLYDDPDFFAGYSRLPRSQRGLDGAPEWPALRALLPALRGLRVVDLGCGFGWFARWAAEQGAAAVLGLDASRRMLDRARADNAHQAITYAQADLEHVDLPHAAFDLAWSALALHYVPDAARLLAQIYRALVPGGRLVLSTEHPIFTAPTTPAWATAEAGHRIWPLDRYLVEGPRITDWLAPGVVKQHRTLGTTLTTLIRAGFTLTHVEEFRPTDEQIAAAPSLAEERDRPMFLLLAAHR